MASGTGEHYLCHGWAHTDPSNSDNLDGDGGGWACACARVCACVCLCVCVRACVRDVFAIYDNIILPRLKMIIIKPSILLFHTNHTH